MINVGEIVDASALATVFALLISSYAAYITYKSGVKTLKYREFEFKTKVYDEIYNILIDTQEKYMNEILDDIYIHNIKVRLKTKSYILFDSNVKNEVLELIDKYSKNLVSSGTGKKNDLNSIIQELLLLSYKEVIS